MTLKNQVQLITYPDSLGGGLTQLYQVLHGPLDGLFAGGIHILPPFPSSGDRGFAPLTYLEIEPAFGTWEDIRRIGEEFDVLVDLMVNHISRQSPYFQDFLAKGRASEYAGLFITLDKIWEDGVPVQADIEKIFLRRLLPYSSYTLGSGEEEKVWTTFGKTDPSEQIDLDVNSPLTRELLRQFFLNFKQQNVRIVRLDAVGYVIKKLGTSCFFVEPEIYEFLGWIKEMADSLEIELLPEVHSHYSIQQKLSDYGCWIYDFILPYRVLEALTGRTNTALYDYLRTRPHKQFTMLDCHDGIPVKPDLDDLIDTKEARELVGLCEERGANLSLILSEEHKAPDGFDVHQIRCTYYSALNEDDDAYLAARAIQFFAPGIPQVYYVGLLAGRNDLEQVALSGEGREINRHNYTLEEIEAESQREVVQRLMKLIRFRNEYGAFGGTFRVLEAEPDEIRLMWEQGAEYCRLHINLQSYQTVIEYIDEQGQETVYCV
ncbi:MULTISPECIES: sucrose phosphorylase [unclassified Paenibacillus]|uniref:sucrose phosphorylase n=1 Tax=unclassified Paenibacillus TaxID=185978 RepID=UPI0024066AE1|nr:MULTISPECIES: sucrose phosphorylase [unclassified Paenibacillus]MDF9843642.1 sucrose phosphorylase [Paenibacillus sp. PastF-2]MDF9850230.1 sucrose phosphorylase [Paenibacillus sp. PastM-2]MDF9856830.1 sucrose phosphorylase [Paenibacillus sp. PastF-1]MDH6482077.1 sucrose phosphorylase [Paenibacillus sp. PastH-2]MDH6509500.1 sucrose phosphorylase [Paenibacillus sp. PastM-3]